MTSMLAELSRRDFYIWRLVSGETPGELLPVATSRATRNAPPWVPSAGATPHPPVIPAWYRYSPRPGQTGPSTIEGHIDSAANGPSVFFRLGALHPGDSIAITRSDHTIATFRVDKVAEYPKDAFPTAAVYGDTATAQLRLITCGGTFDSTAHSYNDNIVVYASLVPH